MSSQSMPPEPSRDGRIDSIIAQYLEAVERGETPDQQKLLARHADLADELATFFADQKLFQQAASPLLPENVSPKANEPFPAPANPGSDSNDFPTRLSVDFDPNAPDRRLVDGLGLPPTEDHLTPGQRGQKSSARPGSIIRYFGDYELLSEIARGGMGVVYKARQVKLNRVVAMKMILAGQLASPEDVRRFYSEAEAAAKLSHPHIVPIFEVGEHEQQHYFSMAFVDGQSLAHRIAQGVLEPNEAARLLKDVASAIAYAHREGVIHRDLKPGNILLEGRGVRGEGRAEDFVPSPSALAPHPSPLIPKVTDFGLAKRVTGEASGLTVTGQILGTPSYMPPEQARGESAEVSYLSDVYSLGAVLYCMVTGRPPFQASNAVDTLVQVLNREPVSPRQLNASVPLDLETIILKCLEKKPSQRYASAQHLVDELTRFLEGRPILARPVSAVERVWRLCRRHPAIASLTAGIAASLVIGTVVSWSYAVQADKQAKQALLNANRADEQTKVAKANADRADKKSIEATDNAKRADAKAAEAIAEKTRADLKTNEAVASAKKAQIEKDRADTKAEEARRSLYASRMYLAQAAWEDSRVGRVWELLKLCEPKLGEKDLRGFEWYYWNRLARSYQMNLDGHSGSVTSVAYSADGKRLASASGDQTVKLWDAASGDVLLTLNGHTGEVGCVALSPDGKRLASVSIDREKRGEMTVKLWDTTTGQETLKLNGHAPFVRSVAFSPDGKRLATAGGNQRNQDSPGELKVWDASSGQEALTLTGHTWLVMSAVFSSDGKWLVSGGADRTVKVWDATSGQVLVTASGHTGPVVCVAFSTDGKWLASASEDQTVKVWGATNGLETLTLKGHTDGVKSVAFSPDGKRLASAGHDQTVKVWDLLSGHETLALKGHTHWIQSVAFSPNGKSLASGSYDGTVKVWDATVRPGTLTLRGHTGVVTGVAISRDGKRLASAGGDATVKVWNVENGQETLTLKGHTDTVNCVAISRDGQRVASGSFGRNRTRPPDIGGNPTRPLGEFKVWDAMSGLEVLALKGHTNVVSSVAFSPDGKRLASASMDRTVKLWDTTTGQETLTLKAHRSFANCVAFSPDGKRLVSCSGDSRGGEVKVWDATTGQETLSVMGGTRSAMFSPDGKRLAAASGVTVKILNAVSGHETLTLNGHTGAVMSVAFSEDGKRLASASFDQTVKLWDATSGEETLTLKGHTNGVTSVAFGADGKLLVSGSGDGTVKMWDATPRR